MRKLTLATVLASALLVVSNIASAAIVHDGTSVYWQQPEGVDSLTVSLTKSGGTNWHYGLYSLDTGNNWDVELNDGETTFNLAELNVTKVGVWGYQSNGSGNSGEKLQFSVGTNSAKDFHFYEGSTNTMISFGKNGTDKANVVFGVTEGGTVGAPLPTPVATLLIALGLGAAFVMYRSRKQQAEA